MKPVPGNQVSKWAHGSASIGLLAMPHQYGGLSGIAEKIDQTAGGVLDGLQVGPRL
ncbi:hypothetical protein [Mycobacterium sp.]|uniref:hypothetical protein n=1 Tax=Mycobacterium sp. TaxID=1785 RepID=UPI0039C9D87F